MTEDHHQLPQYNLQFTFINQLQRLRIFAQNPQNHTQYIGSVSSHLVKDFNLIKDLLQNGEFKICFINDQIIAIKTSPISFQLTSTSSKIKALEQQLQILEKRQYQLSSIVKSQENQILKLQIAIYQYKTNYQEQQKINIELKKQLKKKQQDLKQLKQSHEKIIAQNKKLNKQSTSAKDQIKEDEPQVKLQNLVDVYPLGLEKEKITWSDYRKYKSLNVKGNVVTNEETVEDCCFALLNVGFKQSVKRKQCWGIKVLKSEGSIGVGICSQYLLYKAGHGEKMLNWADIGNGCCILSQSGNSYSHSFKEFNDLKQFKFSENDVVYMEYDPIEWKIRFQKNDGPQRFVMPIKILESYDFYCPCVQMTFEDESVELILPGKPLS